MEPRMSEERIAELLRVTRSVCSCISDHEAYSIGSVIGELISEVRTLNKEIDKLTSKESTAWQD